MTAVTTIGHQFHYLTVFKPIQLIQKLIAMEMIKWMLTIAGTWKAQTLTLHGTIGPFNIIKLTFIHLVAI